MKSYHDPPLVPPFFPALQHKGGGNASYQSAAVLKITARRIEKNPEIHFLLFIAFSFFPNYFRKLHIKQIKAHCCDKPKLINF